MTLPLSSTVLSPTVGMDRVAALSPSSKTTVVGGVPLTKPSSAVTLTFTVSSSVTSPSRSRVNTAGAPSFPGPPAVMVTLGRSLSAT